MTAFMVVIYHPFSYVNSLSTMTKYYVFFTKKSTCLAYGQPSRPTRFHAQVEVVSKNTLRWASVYLTQKRPGTRGIQSTLQCPTDNCSSVYSADIHQLRLLYFYDVSSSTSIFGSSFVQPPIKSSSISAFEVSYGIVEFCLPRPSRAVRARDPRASLCVVSLADNYAATQKRANSIGFNW